MAGRLFGGAASIGNSTAPAIAGFRVQTSVYGLPIPLVFGPVSLVGPMRAADLAVSAAGQTLYALARLGVPTVALELADNQRGGLAALEHAGAVRVAGRAGEPGLPDAVAAAVRELVTDDAARHRLARAAGSLLDGQGARRVAAEICRLGASIGIETRR